MVMETSLTTTPDEPIGRVYRSVGGVTVARYSLAENRREIVPDREDGNAHLKSLVDCEMFYDTPYEAFGEGLDFLFTGHVDDLLAQIEAADGPGFAGYHSCRECRSYQPMESDDGTVCAACCDAAA